MDPLRTAVRPPMLGQAYCGTHKERCPRTAGTAGGWRTETTLKARSAVANSTLAPAPPPSLRTSLLQLIAERPAHGLELRRQLSRFGRGSVHPGHVYRALGRMEKDGLVVSSWETSGPGSARRVYRLVGEPTPPTARSEKPQHPPKAPRPGSFALAELERAVGRFSGEDMAEVLGTTTRTIFRLRRAGMSYVQADRYAVRAGLHPGDVWPQWWTLDG